MILQHCFYTPIKQNKRSWKTGQVDIMNRRTSDEKSHVLYPGPKLIFFAFVLFPEIPADYESHTRFTDCILKHPNNSWI